MGRRNPLKGFSRVGGIFKTKMAAMKRARPLRGKFRTIRIIKGKLTGRGGVGIKPKTRTVFRIWVKD